MPGETEGQQMSGYQIRWASEMLFPKLFLNTLSVLGLLRALGISILHQFGLLGFIDPCDPTRIPDILSLTLRRPSSITSGANLLLRQRLPVMKFAETFTEEAGEEEEENSSCSSCSVCLCEFEDEEEVRWLVGSCKHMFHKECLDKWIDHGRRTCPLCRAAFLSGYELEEEEEEEEVEAVAEVFDGRWLCAAAPDFEDW